MSNMIEFTLQQAESFVENNPNAEWDGWNINIFVPTALGQYEKNGVFRNGQWFKKKVIAVNEKGTYIVGNNYARIPSKTRNLSK